MRRSISRGLVMLAALLTLVLGSALPALAHNSLTGSDPKDGATLDEAPARVVLTFDQPVGEDGTGIVVQGPGKEAVQDGSVQVTDNKVTQPLKPLTEAGEYTIGYRAVSADGHPVTGELTFTVSEEAVQAGAGEASAAPSAAATPQATEPTGAAGGTEQAGSDSSWVWPAGIAVAVVLAGAVALFLLRRRDT